jgi:hypothetical protein
VGPEGAVRDSMDWPAIGTVRIPNPAAPSGLNTFFWLTQGKPWAMLSWPFGPLESAIRILERSTAVGSISGQINTLPNKSALPRKTNARHTFGAGAVPALMRLKIPRKGMATHFGRLLSSYRSS